MNKILIAAAMLASVMIASCAKKAEPAKVEPVTQEAPKENTDSLKAAKNAEDVARRDRLEGERLEQQRSLLEDMMNRLMAEEIYFEYDKATLSEKAKTLLAEAADIMQKEPKLWVEVQGHTDERGSEAYNLTLGSKRAQAVVQYLIDYGVTNDRLKSISYGEEAPKVQGATEDAYAKNRRAAFKVQIRK